MNPLDYVLIGVLLFFFVAGYVKGFLAQFLQILAILASFFLASRFYLAVAENSLFEGMRQKSASAAQVTAWVGIFFVSGAILSVLTSLAAKRFQNEHMRPGDRWLGALFSAAKGVILLGGIALGLQEWKFPNGTALPPAEQRAAEGLVTSSVLVPRLGEACFAVVSAIPTQQRDALRKMIEQRRFYLDPGNAGDGDPHLVTPLVPDGEAIEKAAAEPADTKKPVLLPLGELRKLRMKKEEGAPKLAPTSAKEE